MQETSGTDTNFLTLFLATSRNFGGSHGCDVFHGTLCNISHLLTQSGQLQGAADEGLRTLCSENSTLELAGRVGGFKELQKCGPDRSARFIAELGGATKIGLYWWLQLAPLGRVSPARELLKHSRKSCSFCSPFGRSDARSSRLRLFVHKSVFHSVLEARLSRQPTALEPQCGH